MPDANTTEDIEEDGPPTRRDSGTLDVFGTTCREAFERLRRIPLDDEGHALLYEASTLLTVLDGWRIVAPRTQADRPAVIARVFELHRRTFEYVARRRSELEPPR